MDNEKGQARLYRIFVFLGTVITICFSVVSAPLTLLKFGSVFDGVVLLPIAGFLTYTVNKKFIPEPLQEKGILTILPIIAIGILSVFMCLALVYLT
jgi:Mn2+/Fe2+ NRAMP family transporter